MLLRSLIYLVVLATTLLGAGPEDPAQRVVVLANSNNPDSVRLALHYLARRNVPSENLVTLPMTAEETINWRTFIDEIYQPLQDELVRRGWIQAIGTELVDEIGRKRYSITGHRISYLVVCRGVPLRIEHSVALYQATPPLTDRSEFRTNRSAVDSELALVVRSGYAINGAVPNPLFNRANPTFLDDERILKVSRLDGPSYEAAAGLVDRAIEAEKTGLIGRAYVDIGGPHAEGDRWLEMTEKEIEDCDYDLDVDKKQETFSETARFDMPVLYFGWYAGSINGPFLEKGFRFPPGAIALHIHSYSAQSLRSDNVFWCGPLVARGVTATFGNVWEPFLPMTHRPQVIMRTLAEGKTLGDAACLAMPVFSWQAIVIGDPLYRPFATSFAQQWEQRSKLDDRRFAYVVDREANRLLRAGQVDKALETARDGFRERPSIVLAWRMAKICESNALSLPAEEWTEKIERLEDLAPDQIPLGEKLADLFLGRGQAGLAVRIYGRLLGTKGLDAERKIKLLKPAIMAAEKAEMKDVLELWRRMEAETSAK